VPEHVLPAALAAGARQIEGNRSHQEIARHTLRAFASVARRHPIIRSWIEDGREPTRLDRVELKARDTLASLRRAVATSEAGIVWQEQGNQPAEFEFYGSIEPGARLSADRVQRALSKLRPYQSVTAELDSPGGDTDEARRIVRAMLMHRGLIVVSVASRAHSAATLLAAFADRCVAARAATFVFHHSAVQHARPTAAVIRRQLPVLEADDDRYISEMATAMGQSRDRVAALCDREACISASEALSLGLVTELRR
jgi:ATP-dependent protease ClpP protease subunit